MEKKHTKQLKEPNRKPLSKEDIEIILDACVFVLLVFSGSKKYFEFIFPKQKKINL